MMTTERDPLLAQEGRRHDDASPDDDSSSVSSSESRARFRELVLFAWALVATAAVIIVAVWTQHNQQTGRPPSSPPPQRAWPEGKRNLIFMVSDGMGPAPLSLTRSFRQHVEGLPAGDTLTLDKHFWGTSRTRSSNSLVTDSAAGATAFSCGRKSYNGAISMLPDLAPCGSVMEAAKRAGYTTGLVVTTDITDATPACFASHVLMRSQNDEIALQEVGDGVLGRVVDLMLGGGRCHFLPNTTDGSCRLDDVDVVDIARRKHGWRYVDDRAGFDGLQGGDDVELPTLGLFARADIPFELDRSNMNDVYPSLSEMTKTALRALDKATRDSDKGFFVMIEASRIDHAAHINDPAAQVREVLEYDKAFQAVLDFLEESETEGVLVATSDHETGGLSVALQEPGHLPVYNWYPKALASVNASAELLSYRLREHMASNPSISEASLKKWINQTLVVPGLGILNALPAELDALIADPDYAVWTFGAMISLRAHVGWSTHGHSAVDVNIYSSGGPGTDMLRGNVENTDVGKFLRKYLGVDVESITEELREKMPTSGLGAMPMEALQPGHAPPQDIVGEGADHWMRHWEEARKHAPA